MLFNNDNDRDNIITGDFWIAKVPTANWKSFWIVEDLGSSNFLGSSRSILSAKFTFGPSKTSRSSNYLESSMTIFPFKNRLIIRPTKPTGVTTPTRVSQRYQENILGTSRLILRSPDGDKKRKLYTPWQTLEMLESLPCCGGGFQFHDCQVNITNYNCFTR